MKLKKIAPHPQHEIRYILILAAIQIVNVIDFVIMMPLGPTLMDGLSITPPQFSTLISSYSFSGAIIGFIFGMFADKYDRKNLLIITMIGFIVTTLGCGLSNSFTTLLTMRTLTGVFAGTLTTIVFALVSDLIPFERRGKAMGIIMSSFSVASVLGVPLGLAIADATNWQNSFHFIVLISIPILLLIILTFPNVFIEKENETNMVKDLKVLFTKSKNTISFLLIFCVSGSMFLLIPFLSTYAVKNIEVDTTDLKWAYMVGGVFTIITSRIIGICTDKFGGFKVFFALVMFSTVPILWFTHSGPLSLSGFLALQTFFMTTVSGRLIPVMTLISEVPKPEERGLFMGMLNSVRALGRGIMTFLSGFVITTTATGKLMGYGTAGIISISIALITILFAYTIASKVSSQYQKVSI